MENVVKMNAMLAVYQAARDALMKAAASADEAVKAIQQGSANLAVGTAIDAKINSALATTMLEAAEALHRAGR